ncbi:MAG: hypothetical protein QM778_23520 [Myxococcales bacterium]
MLQQSLKWLFRVTVFSVMFVVNPGYLTGCEATSEDNDVDTRKVEMELLSKIAEVNERGTWSFVTNDRHHYEVSLMLEAATEEQDARASWMRGWTGNRASACGTRTFFKGASACATEYEMAVLGTLSLRDVDADRVVLVDVKVKGRVSSYDEIRLAYGENEKNQAYLSSLTTEYASASFTDDALDADTLTLQSP